MKMHLLLRLVSDFVTFFLFSHTLYYLKNIGGVAMGLTKSSTGTRLLEDDFKHLKNENGYTIALARQS